MASNLFDRLAESEVPPPPAHFEAQLHDRVNRRLVQTQFLDLMLVGLPWALVHFSRAVVALIALTLTGKLETHPKDRDR